MKKINQWWEQNKTKLLFAVLVVVLILIVLLPIFKTGYIADNSIGYYTKLNFDFQSILKMIFDSVVLGRVHLTNFLSRWWLNKVNSLDLVYVQWNMIFFTLLSVASFYLCFKELGKKGWLVSSLFFLPLLFQLRTTHDPFLVYFGDFQLFLALFFLSLWFFIKFLKIKKDRWGWWSVLVFFLMVNNHEANVMFWPIFVLVFWLITHKFWTKQVWPIIINAASCLFAYFCAPILQLILRLPAQSYGYSGTAVNFSPVLAIKSWLVQTAAALPLNYFFSRSGQEALSYYPHLWFDNLPILFLGILIFGVIFYLIFMQINWSKKEIDKRLYLFLALIGVALWILPAFPVAVSAKNQYDLVNLFGMQGGMSYVMVYYQYFGVAILLGLGLSLCLVKLKYKKIFLSILTLTCGLIFYVNYITNVAVAKQINKGYDDERFIVTQAVKSGFFNELKDKSINLYLNHYDTNYYRVNDDNFLLVTGLQQILGKQIKINQSCTNNELINLNDNQSLGLCTDQFLINQNNYFLYYDQIDEYSGYVILAPITSFYQTIPTGYSVQIFYYSAYLNDNWAGTIIPKLRRDLWTTYYAVENGQPVLQENRQWIVRDRETNSTIVTIESEQPILLDSIVPALIQPDRESLQLVDPVN